MGLLSPGPSNPTKIHLIIETRSSTPDSDPQIMPVVNGRPLLRYTCNTSILPRDFALHLVQKRTSLFFNKVIKSRRTQAISTPYNNNNNDNNSNRDLSYWLHQNILPVFTKFPAPFHERGAVFSRGSIHTAFASSFGCLSKHYYDGAPSKMNFSQ